MEIPVKLFGALRHYLPAGSGFNSCSISLDEGASLDALLDKVQGLSMRMEELERQLADAGVEAWDEDDGFEPEDEMLDDETRPIRTKGRR